MKSIKTGKGYKVPHSVSLHYQDTAHKQTQPLDIPRNSILSLHSSVLPPLNSLPPHSRHFSCSPLHSQVKPPVHHLPLSAKCQPGKTIYPIVSFFITTHSIRLFVETETVKGKTEEGYTLISKESVTHMHGKQEEEFQGIGRENKGFECTTISAEGIFPFPRVGVYVCVCSQRMCLALGPFFPSLSTLKKVQQCTGAKG